MVRAAAVGGDEAELLLQQDRERNAEDDWEDRGVAEDGPREELDVDLGVDERHGGRDDHGLDGGRREEDETVPQQVARRAQRERRPRDARPEEPREQRPEEVRREARDRRPAQGVVGDVGGEVAERGREAAERAEEDRVGRPERRHGADVREARDEVHRLEGQGDDEVRRHEPRESEERAPRHRSASLLLPRRSRISASDPATTSAAPSAMRGVRATRSTIPAGSSAPHTSEKTISSA